MIAPLVLWAQAMIFIPTPAPVAPVFDAPVVDDAVLATQRGGLRLPNGIDVALAVQTQTAINGAIVLQTVYAIDQGPASLTAYAPPQGGVVLAERSGTPTGPTTMSPTISYDPRTGIRVTQGFNGVPVTVGGSAAQGGPSAVPAGLVRVDEGTGMATGAGSVASRSDGLLRIVTLSGSDFAVSHLAGAAFGSVIANTGSDRAIDTITNISIDLRNAGPDALGSAMFRVENIALGALGSRL